MKETWIFNINSLSTVIISTSSITADPVATGALSNAVDRTVTILTESLGDDFMVRTALPA